MSYHQYCTAGARAEGSVDDDLATELMKLLEAHGSPTPVRVRFTDEPYSFAVVFRSSSDYVTINGNEETRGSSYSYSDSSVMASVDCGGASGLRHGDAGAREWWLGAAARRRGAGGGYGCKCSCSVCIDGVD